VLLAGGGAAVPGAREVLERLLQTEVRIVGPADLVRCPEELLPRCLPTMTAALGLAMSPEGGV